MSNDLVVAQQQHRSLLTVENWHVITTRFVVLLHLLLLVLHLLLLVLLLCCALPYNDTFMCYKALRPGQSNRYWVHGTIINRAIRVLPHHFTNIWITFDLKRPTFWLVLTSNDRNLTNFDLVTKIWTNFWL